MTYHPHRHRRVVVAAAAGLALLLGAAGCERVQPKVTPPPPARVSVSLPVTGDVTDYEEFPGRTDAVMSVEIRSRVTGYLTKVHFADGDEVPEGTLLFEIDSSPYDAELARAEATVVQSEAHLKRLDADYRRAASLYGRGNISREEFDRAGGDRAEAEASVGIAVASRKAAQLDVDFCKIKAPIAGRLSRRLVDPGNLVKADETPMTTIVSLDPVYLYFDIDERTVLRLRRLVREGTIKSRTEAEIPVVAGLSDEDDFPHTGIINFSENKVDPSTGTLRVRASIPNPKPRVLSAGLFMRVRLPIGTPRKSLMIPEQALGSDQGKKYVYVVDSRDEIVYRPVKVGRLDRGLRVIEEGLSPSERVVVSGLQRVRPGARVTAVRVGDEPKARTAASPADAPLKTAAGG